MDGLVWVSQTANQSARFLAEDEPSDQDVEDGVLEEKEKKELRTLYLDEVLDERDKRIDEESSHMGLEASHDGFDLRCVRKSTSRVGARFIEPQTNISPSSNAKADRGE